jgi:hypothetical protein
MVHWDGHEYTWGDRKAVIAKVKFGKNVASF